MTGDTVVTASTIAAWVGYIISSWGIGFVMGIAWRAFIRVIELTGGG